MANEQQVINNNKDKMHYFIVLTRYKHQLSRQQFQTLKGQIMANDGLAAMKGLESILGRKVNY